jgi:hypothetical protein
VQDSRYISPSNNNAAFELGSTHAGSDTLDDQSAESIPASWPGTALSVIFDPWPVQYFAFIG